MSLPLTVRKNIRDNEVKLKENLERISKASGKDFEFEADWANAVVGLSDNQKNSIGEVYQKDAMEYLAKNIENLCKNEMSKEALDEATSSNKIIIRPNDKVKNYWAATFENGALVLEHKKNIANLYEIGNFDLVSVMPTPGLPLATRLVIDKFKPNLDEYLQTIAELTGESDWTLEADFEKVLPQLDERTKINIGEIYYKDVMGYLVNNLKKTLVRETTKESFNEAASQHKIIIETDSKQKNYWDITFANGAVKITHKPSIANLYEIGNVPLEERIPSPGLPLVTRLSIEQYREPLEEKLQKVAELTGESDWSFEIDFEKFIKAAPNHTKDAGEFFYKDVLDYLVKNLERTLKSETTRESFNEATSQHKIIVEINDKIKNYWEISFADGALRLSHKAACANLYEIGNIPLEDRIPSPGLPLVTRLNIEKFREKLEENLEQINKVTGESDWTVEVDFEKIIKLNPNKLKDAGEFYYNEALSYLVKNLQRALAAETTRESFNEATSQHKVIFDVNDKQRNYWDINFEDGALKVTHKKECANLYEIGNLPLEEKIPSPGLPLVTRLNIEKFRENLEENLEKIREITGESDWAFEADFEKLIKLNPNKLKDAGEGYYKEVLGYLVTNLKRTLAKEATKEAFLEATSQRKIVVRVTENPKETKYWNLFFENGELVLQHKKDFVNLYEIGNFQLEAVMPVPGTLSLLARLNIQDAQEKLTEHLETIKAATGEDYSFDDSCLEAVYKSYKNNPNNIGETFLKEAMGYLAENLKKSLADDMVKEAFNETATAHQISFKPADPKAPTYWSIKFENGAVVLYFKPEPANLYEIRNFDIEKLL